MNEGHHRAFVGLGGNLDGPLGTPADYVRSALTLLSEAQGIERVSVSRLYRSPPWGKTDQGEFVNAVAECRTKLGPATLLDTLLSIEARLGRQRGEKWGPRVIDLDLLSYDDLVLDDEHLTVPHPLMHQRTFVLVPLLELDPDFVIPGRGRADECLSALSDAGDVVPS